MSEQHEQRKAPRIQPFVAPCRWVRGDQRVPGFLTDLSANGCRIHADEEPPAIGSPLVVEARLGRHATHLHLPASVCWSRVSPRGGFEFGMRFDGVDTETQKALEAVIEEFRRRAASIA